MPKQALDNAKLRAAEAKGRTRTGLEQTAREMRKHVITAITAAFAFIIALTWRDAIKDGLDRLLQELGVAGVHCYFRGC